MNILLVVAVGVVLLLVASRTYPFWIARVFDLDDRRDPPSVQHADGAEYVRTPTQIVFAHHFASIAGAGPIVGPVLALAFGWGPAWVWIIAGGILYGAVHDMTTMCVSLREGGRTIAEIARRTLGTPGYLLFVTFLLLIVSVVNAVFLKLSAGALSSSYPLVALGLEPGQSLLAEIDVDGVRHGRIGGIATTSVIVMTAAAPFLGMLVRRGTVRGVAILAIAAVVCLIGVLVGFVVPVALTSDTWMIVLSGYVFAACVVPVWLILQPRDFMNVQILYVGLALLLLGAIVGGLRGETMQIATSRIADAPAASGPFWPMMFITIACGAISGFHSLVATGTTIKQVPRESDCRRIGFNGMLLESGLALLVLVAVASQLDGATYGTLIQPANGGPVLTFAVGCGSLFTGLGIPMPIGCVLGILVIEGFLVTTLDTSIRLARYLIEELIACLTRRPWRATVPTTIATTAVAVVLMLLFAYSKDAAGALWPYFGAGNQLIAALALTTVSIWLLQRGRRAWFTALPAAFMVATGLSALAIKVSREATAESGNAVVTIAGSVLLVLAGGFVVISLWQIRRAVRHDARKAASADTTRPPTPGSV